MVRTRFSLVFGTISLKSSKMTLTRNDQGGSISGQLREQPSNWSAVDGKVEENAWPNHVSKVECELFVCSRRPWAQLSSPKPFSIKRFPRQSEGYLQEMLLRPQISQLYVAITQRRWSNSCVAILPDDCTHNAGEVPDLHNVSHHLHIPLNCCQQDKPAAEQLVLTRQGRSSLSLCSASFLWPA
jgi:hypothetical protein